MKLVVAAVLAGIVIILKLNNGMALEERIYNGYLAKQGQFPHQASLIMTFSDGKNTLCGGSLISRNFVLTAAHCTYRATSLSVTLGHLQYDDFTSNGVQTFTVTASNVYFNNYDPNTLTNDISLIKLPKSVTITNVVNTINLPPRAWADPDVVAKQYVLESGWGKANDSAAAPQRDLHFAYGYTMLNKDCLNIWTNSRPAGKSIICTDRRVINSGVCFGDSGGPLGFNYNNKSYVLGIASYVATCYTQNYPNVFTYTGYYLDWISKTAGIAIS